MIDEDKKRLLELEIKVALLEKSLDQIFGTMMAALEKRVTEIEKRLPS